MVVKQPSRAYRRGHERARDDRHRRRPRALPSRRRGGADHPQPPRAAQRAEPRGDGGGDGDARADRPRPGGPRDRRRGGRARVLRRARPRRDGRPRPRLLPARLRRLHADDGRDPRRAAAGHRARARDRDRRRLPARRRVRPRRRGRGGALRDARRAHRPVLLDADGPAVPCGRPQARARDAPDRDADRRRDGARLGARQPRRPGRGARRDGGRPGRVHRRVEQPHRRDRQGGVLRPDRPRRAARVRPHEDRDVDEHARRRRPGGDLRVPREARPRPGPGGGARPVYAPRGRRRGPPAVRRRSSSWHAEHVVRVVAAPGRRRRRG